MKTSLLLIDIIFLLHLKLLILTIRSDKSRHLWLKLLDPVRRNVLYHTVLLLLYSHKMCYFVICAMVRLSSILFQNTPLLVLLILLPSLVLSLSPSFFLSPLSPNLDLILRNRSTNQFLLTTLILRLH